MSDKRKVILVTDGDRVAQHVIEYVARKFGGRCISLSAGNPTFISGAEIVRLIKAAPYDPVFVMLDDKGKRLKGPGESALEYIVKNSDIDVIGVIAVASNTEAVNGVKVDCSITRDGQETTGAVDKNGYPTGAAILSGDTVDILSRLSVPVIVGIGDIGKMDGLDSLEKGAPITTKAINKILCKGDALNGN
ncbi:MAG: stage V sporulation protein AE [Syntrophomonadaceae bacterium]|jgi:stage V sporulation protein AE|nr:stage V sporulation protein AE [Syntrophomonadaceae bacterium]